MSDRYNDDYPTRPAIKAHIEDLTIHQRITPLTHNRSVGYIPNYPNTVFSNLLRGDGADSNTNINITVHAPTSVVTTLLGQYYSFACQAGEEVQNHYNIYVSFKLPADFISWASNAVAIRIMTNDTNTAVTKFKINIYKSGNNTAILTIDDLTTADPAVSELKYITSTQLATGSTTWAAGDTLELTIIPYTVIGETVSLGSTTFYYQA
jgi:hypothetical protein